MTQSHNGKFVSRQGLQAELPVIKGLVSVIIPTYNRAKLVVEAIESARAQTYPEKQIIVIDDGSTDDIAHRVAAFPGVEYYRQENRGQGAARNYGLRMAQGEFIASLDSDDLWDEDFLTRSIDRLEASSLDFVFSNWMKLRAGNLSSSEWLRDQKWKPFQKNLNGEWSLLTPAEVRRLFLQLCPAPSSSLVVRRSRIGSGWGEHMQIADDWYLILAMVLHHPCRAAFTLTPRWKKRVDGLNVYDGKPFIESVRKLYLHDYRFFARDFRDQLTKREKALVAFRQMKYRVRLSMHDLAATDLAGRLRIPMLVEQLRGRARVGANNS